MGSILIGHRVGYHLEAGASEGGLEALKPWWRKPWQRRKHLTNTCVLTLYDLGYHLEAGASEGQGGRVVLKSGLPQLTMLVVVYVMSYIYICIVMYLCMYK